MAKRTLAKTTSLDLQRELARRRRAVPKLLDKRRTLLEQVAAIEAHVRLLGSAAGEGQRAGPGRKRPKNDQNLIEALAQLLDGKDMNVTAAAAAVQDAGYKTTAANFRTIVNQTLINSGRFKRISRGVYTTKAAKPAS